MASFSETSLPPIVRVGNSADAIHAIARDTAPTPAPSVVMGPVIFRVEAQDRPALECAPTQRPTIKRRAK